VPSVQTQAEALAILTWSRESDKLSDSDRKLDLCQATAHRKP